MGSNQVFMEFSTGFFHGGFPRSFQAFSPRKRPENAQKAEPTQVATSRGGQPCLGAEGANASVRDGRHQLTFSCRNWCFHGVSSMIFCEMCEMFHDVSIMFFYVHCHCRRALVELVIWCSFRADGGTLDEVFASHNMGYTFF